MRALLLGVLLLLNGCQATSCPTLRTIPKVPKMQGKHAKTLAKKLRVSEGFYYNQITNYNKRIKR